MSKLLHIYK